ncbi:MAG: hypothetical protein RLP44_16005 [Aggregatilineales bacterium]
MSREIVVAIFPSRALLANALDHITDVRDVVVKRAAIVAKVANGETVILDDTLGATEGGIAGGILGGTLTALGFVQLGALNLPNFLTIIALALAIMFGSALGVLVGRLAAQTFNVSFRKIHTDALVSRIQVGKPVLILEIKNDQAMLLRIIHELNLFHAEFISRNGDDNQHLNPAA